MTAMPFVARIILMAFSTGMAILSGIPVIMSRNTEQRLTGRKEFLLEPLFPAGGYVNVWLGLGGHRERVRIERMQELVPFAEAQQISRSADEAPACYIILFVPLILSVFSVTGSFLFLIAGAGLLAFLCIYFDWKLKQTLKERHLEILSEFPEMLTDFSLMVHAGVTVNTAFTKVAESSDGVLYQEMKKCAVNMNHGMSVDAAMNAFLIRCPLREIKKFVSLFRQTLSKGGEDFPRALEEMAEAAWVQRKNTAKEQGQLAEQKLLLPTLMMFLGILMMVIVPAFRSLLF